MLCIAKRVKNCENQYSRRYLRTIVDSDFKRYTNHLLCFKKYSQMSPRTNSELFQCKCQ